MIEKGQYLQLNVSIALFKFHHSIKRHRSSLTADEDLQEQIAR